MDNIPKINLVVDKLQKEGYSQEKITQFLDGLVNLATEMFYQEAMNVFTADDLGQIESCKTELSANDKIRELYINKTSKNPDQAVKEFFEQFADGFLTGKDYSELLKSK